MRAGWLIVVVASVALSVLVPREAHAQQAEEERGSDEVGYYVLPSGRWVDAAEAMEWSREHRQGRGHPWRALIEDGIVLGAGTLWYVFNTDVNSQDFDLSPQLRSLWTKIVDLDQVRFDNNTFLFNNGWHALTSLGYYHFPRANDLSVWASLGMTFGLTTLWEYAFELREKVSINDQIVTTLAGVALGEVSFQLGEYFNSPQSRGDGAGRWLTGVFGAPRLLHRWMDDELGEWRGEDYERWGGDIWRRFALWGAFDLRAGRDRGAREVRPNGAVGASTRLFLMPGHGRAGEYSTWFFDGRRTGLEVEVGFGPRGFEAIDIFAEVGLLGHYAQRVASSPREGSALTWSLNNAYRVLHQNHDFWEDQRGVVHVVGPGVSWVAWRRGARVELELRAYADFAAIRSQAYLDWRVINGDEGIRTDLAKHSYYFAWGGSVLPRLGVEWRGFDVEVAMVASLYDSIEGLDRFEEEVTRVLELDDVVVEHRVRVGVPVGRAGWGVDVVYGSTHRRSSIDDFRRAAVLYELQTRLRYGF